MSFLIMCHPSLLCVFLNCSMSQTNEKKSYQNMGLVNVVFSPFFGDEEHFLKEEECTGVLCSKHMKGTLQYQLTVGGQVRTLPVDQKGLNLLWMNIKLHTRSANVSQHGRWRMQSNEKGARLLKAASLFGSDSKGSSSWQLSAHLGTCMPPIDQKSIWVLHH